MSNDGPSLPPPPPGQMPWGAPPLGSRKVRKPSRWRWVGIGLGALILLFVIIAIASPKKKTPAALATSTSTTVAPVPAATKTRATSAVTAAPMTAAPTTTVAPTTVPAGPAKTFGDGTHLVGTSIAAGTYRAGGGEGCYWQRLSGLGGTLGDIIANDDAVGPAIVTILPTDKAFSTQYCGTWTPLPSSGSQAISFGDGTFAVGIEIAPGTYQAPGGSSCYWERESAFGAGGINGIISNDNPSGSVVVAIAPTDEGFQTQGCGSWTKA
jgi:hypothetical protein